jgi:hypothetical protein
MLDMDQDGVLNFYEFYFPFVDASEAVEGVGIEEMGAWIMDKEDIICKPFEELIDDLIDEMSNEFAS